MHELSVATALVAQATRAAGDSRVVVVHLRLGRLSGLVPDSLQFGFEIAAAGTTLADARLEVERVEPVVWCTPCDAAVTLAQPNRFRCPDCDTPSGDLLPGRELELVSLEHGRAEVENAYARAVPAEGNPVAQAVLADVFEVRDRVWRGIGMIPRSGWQLAPRWRDYDAEHRFDVAAVTAPESSLCRSGEVMQGLIKPSECSAFGKECTPRRPLGATMVSNEGACAAYFQYRRLEPVSITARPEAVGV